ncbi:MAG: lipid-A-disaccharide synthase [Deltaproteobacteria bacterium]|nr:lipid-A-disaccharide synthase [Deltaproteobacteria bacterium]
MAAPHVTLVAGEASGDSHAAKLVAGLRELVPGLTVSGIGGEALAAQGMEILFPAEELSLVGFSEVLPKLRLILGALKTLKEHMAVRRPGLVILVDFPDFNFRVGRAAHKLGLKVLYYISPQVWAWRPGRARAMARFVDHLACVFPFEKDFFAGRAPGLPVSFVGHPLLDDPELAADQPPLAELPGENWVGLLPGSRMSEVHRLLPVMRQAAEIMHQARPDLSFVLPVAPGLSEAQLAPFLGGLPPWLTLVPGRSWEVMRRARVLLLASGTASLQAAVAGTPMVVVYKTGNFNYQLARRLVKVDHIAMPNLIFGGPLVPELIQDAATPEALAHQGLELWENPARRENMLQGMREVRQRLGGPGASRRTAELARELLERD